MQVSSPFVRLFPSICIGLVLLGCTTPKRGASLENEKPALITETREKLPLPDAEREAEQMKTGMKPEHVVRILGSPDETTTRGFGDKTSEPWDGLEWTYRWVNAGRTPVRVRLVVVFQRVDTTWRLNGWKWFYF